jgi:hypothetical protein
MKTRNERIVEIMEAFNPYPGSAFPEPSQDEYDAMKTALFDAGLTPDKFFGSFGKRVWQNCINCLKDVLEEY